MFVRGSLSHTDTHTLRVVKGFLAPCSRRPLHIQSIELFPCTDKSGWRFARSKARKGKES